ncbi:MAG: HIT family protein, partial [Nitrospiraceae bacterium]
MLEKSRRHCAFCDEIKDKRLPPDFHIHTELANRFVEESGEFIAFPSVTPLRPGHLLLVPKFHITSMLQVSYSEMNGLIEMFDWIVRRMSNLYGEVMFFEHGVGLGKSGGCGIDHAHWHLVPCAEIEMRSILLEIGKAFPSFARTDVNRMRGEISLDSSYLLFGRTFGEAYKFVGDNIESQFLRKIAADAFGCAEWDWRALNGWETLEDTYNSWQRRS